MVSGVLKERHVTLDQLIENSSAAGERYFDRTFVRNIVRAAVSHD